jgi:hypothetical protein
MSLPSTRNVAGMGKSSAPYLRFEALHRIGLSGTEFARAHLIDRSEHEGAPNFLVPNPEDTAVTIKRGDQVWNLIPGFYTWSHNNEDLIPGQFLANFGIAVESISGDTMRVHIFLDYGGKQKDTVEIRCAGGIQPTAKEGRTLMYQGQSALQILTLTPLVLVDRSAHQIAIDLRSENSGVRIQSQKSEAVAGNCLKKAKT